MNMANVFPPFKIDIAGAFCVPRALKDIPRQSGRWMCRLLKMPLCPVWWNVWSWTQMKVFPTWWFWVRFLESWEGTFFPKDGCLSFSSTGYIGIMGIPSVNNRVLRKRPRICCIPLHRRTCWWNCMGPIYDCGRQTVTVCSGSTRRKRCSVSCCPIILRKTRWMNWGKNWKCIELYSFETFKLYVCRMPMRFFSPSEADEENQWLNNRKVGDGVAARVFSWKTPTDILNCHTSWKCHTSQKFLFLYWAS